MNGLISSAVMEITDAISEIADGNETVDFEEFLDVLQQINMDSENDDENVYDKTYLKRYFLNLLQLLQCESANELNIDKFNQYILMNYAAYTELSRLQNRALNAVHYMKYLIRTLNDNADAKPKANHSNHSKPLHPQNHHNGKHHKVTNHLTTKSQPHNTKKSKSKGVSAEQLVSIRADINEYLEDEESMDYTDFISCAREFVSDSYPLRNLNIAHQFICQQQCIKENVAFLDEQDVEIKVEFLVRIISQYGNNLDDINDIVTSVFDKISRNVLKSKQKQIIRDLKDHLLSVDKKSSGIISMEQFIAGLKAANVTSISSRDMKKIFNLSTTNGKLKINLFMERFADNPTYSVLPSNCDELILCAFDGIVKKRDKQKAGKKKKKKKKKKKEIIQIRSSREVEEKDDTELDRGAEDKNGFEKLQVAFKSVDENHDHKINFEEFMAVIIGDLKMELKQTECKQIYYHQQLTRDYQLDLNEFFDQIHEEFLSFPDATSQELLRRYFAKILQEAAPFEKLNQFILDHLLIDDPLDDVDDEHKHIANDDEEKSNPQGKDKNVSHLQTEIVSLYGSMSLNPLLRRIHKQQQFDYTNKYRHILKSKVTATMFGTVIRKIRTDSSLTDKEIVKMHDEWLMCLDRDNHKFNDLCELDFLLFHLGLIISQSLLKQFSNTYLNTVFEAEEMSPRSSRVMEEHSHDEILKHLIPSFMKSSKETSNLELLKSDLSSRLSSLSQSARQSLTKNRMSLTLSAIDDDADHEYTTYEHSKMEFARGIATQLTNIKIKLVDLVGEFVDDQDNIITINETRQQTTDNDDENEEEKQQQATPTESKADDQKQTEEVAPKSATENMSSFGSASSPKLHKRARSELLLSRSKSEAKSILQRRNERIQKQKEKAEKAKKKKSHKKLVRKPKLNKAASTNEKGGGGGGGRARGMTVSAGGSNRNKLMKTTSTTFFKYDVDSPSASQKRKDSLSKPLAGPLLLFNHTPTGDDDEIMDLSMSAGNLNVLTMLNLTKARSADLADFVNESEPNLHRKHSRKLPKKSSKKKKNIRYYTDDDAQPYNNRWNGDKDQVLAEMTVNLRSRVNSLDSTNIENARGRSGSMGVAPTSAMDIDLVSKHQVSENRFWARTTANLLNSDDDHENDGDNDDDADLDASYEKLTESVTNFTPQSSMSCESFSFPEEAEVEHLDLDEVSGDQEALLLKPGALSIKVDEEDKEEDKEEDGDVEYNIVGQEKVKNFDPFIDEAIYDPVTNVLLWSNGSKWIKKDFQVFCGKWRDPHGDIIVIDESGKIHYVMPKLGVFQARIRGFYKIAVHAQNTTYHAQLINTNNMRWDNGTLWKRVGENMYFML